MMRRRFGRGRRGGGASKGRRPALNVARELERLVESGLVPSGRLEPVAEDEVPPSLAAVGWGEDDRGDRRVVAYSPESGGDAWLAGLSVAARVASEGLAAGLLAISPRWSRAARLRLGWLGDLGFPVRALQEPDPGMACEVPAETVEAPVLESESQVAAQIRSAPERELFVRACDVLRGLAQKHGGHVRVRPTGVELVLVASLAAKLGVDGDHVFLETLRPRRARSRLAATGLAEAFDQLEGSLRKVLNDRKIREGEEGFRTRVGTILARIAGAERLVRWPLGSADPDPLDFVGTSSEGALVVGAVRRELGLEPLGPILDEIPPLLECLGALVGPVPRALQLGPPRLVLAAEEVAPPVEAVLSCLTLPSRLFDVQMRRGEPGLSERERRAVSAALPPATPAERRETTTPKPPPEPARGGSEGRVLPFEEVSVFDLESEEAEAQGEGNGGRGGRRRRRRRGRGRSRGRAASEEPAAAPSEAVESEEVPGDDEEPLAPLSPEAPEFLETEAPSYEEEGEEGAEEGESELDRLRLEREARRRARLAKIEPEPEEPPTIRRPRRRAAIVAHADRDSLAAAVLLARDLRLVEGIWVYPQSELMTFFRGVATDIAEETPIYLVGFTASPARETLQAASLYQGRLFWFDHHEWPPEDLEGLRGAIGAETVYVEPGVGTSVPVVLAQCTRRSRFSDKLVDLIRGRFTQHDYERWGRVWWWRLGEIAGRPGERRAEFDPLLAGRPSELAREAAQVSPPPAPREVEAVAGRDFRLVHFGGHELCLVPVEPGLGPHLCARIARERYQAPLSLAWVEGEDRVELAADEVSGRPSFDLGAVVEHLAAKFGWVTALSDADHVARFRIEGLPAHPERLDEVIAELAMGRSILEG